MKFFMGISFTGTLTCTKFQPCRDCYLFPLSLLFQINEIHDLIKLCHCEEGFPGAFFVNI